MTAIQYLTYNNFIALNTIFCGVSLLKHAYSIYKDHNLSKTEKIIGVSGGVFLGCYSLKSALDAIQFHNDLGPPSETKPVSEIEHQKFYRKDLESEKLNCLALSGEASPLGDRKNYYESPDWGFRPKFNQCSTFRWEVVSNTSDMCDKIAQTSNKTGLIDKLFIETHGAPTLIELSNFNYIHGYSSFPNNCFSALHLNADIILTSCQVASTFDQSIAAYIAKQSKRRVIASDIMVRIGDLDTLNLKDKNDLAGGVRFSKRSYLMENGVCTQKSFDHTVVCSSEGKCFKLFPYPKNLNLYRFLFQIPAYYCIGNFFPLGELFFLSKLITNSASNILQLFDLSVDYTTLATCKIYNYLPEKFKPKILESFAKLVYKALKLPNIFLGTRSREISNLFDNIYYYPFKLTGKLIYNLSSFLSENADRLTYQIRNDFLKLSLKTPIRNFKNMFDMLGSVGKTVELLSTF